MQAQHVVGQHHFLIIQFLYIEGLFQVEDAERFKDFHIIYRLIRLIKMVDDRGEKGQMLVVLVESEQQSLPQERPVLRETDLEQLALDTPEYKSLAGISDTTGRQCVYLVHLPVAIQFLVARCLQFTRDNQQAECQYR